MSDQKPVEVVVEKLTKVLAIIEPAADGEIHGIPRAALQAVEIARWVNGYLAVEKVSRAEWDEHLLPLVERLKVAKEKMNERIRNEPDQYKKAVKDL